MDFSIREAHQRHTFEFPPPASTEPNLEVVPLTDGEVNRYRLDVHDIAEEVEIHLHDSSLSVGKRQRKRANTLVDNLH
jgi:hypothetical protein